MYYIYVYICTQIHICIISMCIHIYGERGSKEDSLKVEIEDPPMSSH